jgi:hypothetical protein
MLTLSAVWVVGLMSLAPLRKERMLLLAHERGIDLLTEFRGFRHEVIQPPKNATKGWIGRVSDRHATDSAIGTPSIRLS